MNLSELRRRLPSTRQSFSPATTVRLVVQVKLSLQNHNIFTIFTAELQHMCFFSLQLQMIQGVAALHNVGYLHRDIKVPLFPPTPLSLAYPLQQPSNFAIGASPQRRHQCIMIDFGLARKCVVT